MKLKNSHILLIVMTLFLLISIGSVCASEDANITAYDGSNIVSTNVEITDSNDDALSVNSEDALQANSSSTTQTLNVPSEVKVNSTNTVKIPVNVTENKSLVNITKDDIKISLSYTQNNTTKTKDISDFSLTDNIITFSFDDEDFTSGTLTFTYNNTLVKNTTFKRVINAKIDLLNLVAEYQSGNFTFLLTDIDTGKPIANRNLYLTIITGSVNTGATALTNASGIASFNNANLLMYTMTNNTFTQSYIPVGKQKITIGKDSKDSVLNVGTTTTNVTVTQTTAKITIKNFSGSYGTNKTVEVKLVNAKTGEPIKLEVIKLEMPQTDKKVYYFQTNTNGTCQIAVGSLTSGVYNATVSPNNTANIKKVSAKGTITIKKVAVKIVAKDKTVYYNTGATSTIKVTYKNGTGVSGAIVKVRLYTTSKKYTDYYFQATTKGTVSFSAALAVGKHKMIVSLADTRYSASSVSKTITVKKAPAKITANKGTIYYKQYYTIKLTNTKKKAPIYSAKLNIKIFISSTKYYNYNGYTGADGKLQLRMDLSPGTYKVVISPTSSKNFTANSVTKTIKVVKAPAKLTPTKLTAKYKSNSTFNVKVKNTKTNKVITGTKVKIKVYTGKSYKTYTATTNSNGNAKLKIASLSVGTHKVVITSANKYVSASKATSTIKITK